MTAYWCCASCGWNAGTAALRPGDKCDHCGDDEFMCSECGAGMGCEHLPFGEDS